MGDPAPMRPLPAHLLCPQAAASEELAEGLAEALQQRARGSAVLCYGGAPVRVTAAPLLARDGSPPRMLLAFTPAGRTPE